MSDAKPVNLSTSGPPTTVLDPEPTEALSALDAALAEPEAERRAAVASVAARWPRCLVAWASLGDLGTFFLVPTPVQGVAEIVQGPGVTESW